MTGRCSIPLPRITVPDAEAEKKDDMPKKVAPAMLDGHSKPSVHTVGGVMMGVSLDNKKCEVDVRFRFPKDYERYFRLIRSDYDSEHIKSSELLDRLDGYDVLVALGTNSNLEGKGLPDDANIASVSTTKSKGRAEA